MEFIIALAMKFWQWTLVIVFILIGWLINVLDKRKPSHVPGDQAAKTRIEAKHLFEKHYFGNFTLQISL